MEYLLEKTILDAQETINLSLDDVIFDDFD